MKLDSADVLYSGALVVGLTTLALADTESNKVRPQGREGPGGRSFLTTDNELTAGYMDIYLSECRFT